MKSDVNVAARTRAALLFAVLSTALATLAACGGAKGGAPAGAGAAPPPPQVTVVAVEPKTIPVPFEFTGAAEGSREVEVRARVSGILLQRTYEEGRPVRQGQTLFVIDPAQYKAEVQAASATLAEARAQLARSQRDVSRLEPLLAAHAASRKDYDNAASDADQAKAVVQSAQARLDQAKLSLSYTRVQAPVSGLSSRAEHSEGSLVGPGDDSLLTRISRVQPLWIRFSVPDQTMLTLRKAIADKQVTSPHTRDLEVELVLPDGSVHPERGKVNFSDSLIDPQTGGVALRAEVANAGDHLIPGQFLRVRLQGIERPNAIVVPQRAVQTGQDGKFVFVVGTDGKAQIRPVKVGDWIGQDWLVESGLKAGDKVIVDGAVKVRPDSPVTVVDPNAPQPAAGAPGGAGGGTAPASGAKG
jgi:membrane fusion protein (multidrug efflux system)